LSKPAGIARLLHRPLPVALLGGVCFALTAPPLDFHLGVLLGLAALFVALEPTQPQRGKRRAFLIGWAWASAAGLVGLRFVPALVDRFTPLGLLGGSVALLLLAAFQALGWGLGATLSYLLEARLALDRRLSFPCGVLFACMWPGVFAWTPAALLSEWLPLVQLAELVGERGVSWLLALLVALLAWPLRARWVSAGGSERKNADPHPLPAAVDLSRWRRRSARSLMVGAGLAVGVWGYGLLRLSQLDPDAGPKLTVALIQPATDARLRWERSEQDRILVRLRRLTAQGERQGAELSIWPEAAYPYLLSHAPRQEPAGARAIHAGGVRGPVLLGALTQAADGQGQHNAALIIDSNGKQQLPQAKLQLLWFGESLPFGQSIPWLRKAFYRAGGLVPGSEVALQTHQSPTGAVARIAVLNCYEDILPSVGRRMAKQRPNLLVNVTNDAWFEGSIESALHLRLSALRAVEARLDLVRAVNLGLPAWIDKTGRLRALGQAKPAGVLLVRPSLNDQSPTLYTRAGDYPLLLALGLLLSWYAFRGVTRRARTSEPPPATRA